MPAETLRAGVVIVVRHPTDDLVMAFERLDVAGAWQLPQGGIDVGESSIDAAWREMAEETGLTSAVVDYVGCSEHWFGYRYPPGITKNGNHIGQCHQWFTFIARDAEVMPVLDHEEFGAWCWMRPTDLVDVVVEFRRSSYRLGLGIA
jgi:putative (di)nucleoside polyphosphate hydrolase